MKTTDIRPIILAVDDSPVILKTVSSVLSDEFNVLTLSKPAELRLVLQKTKPDLFLLDYKMPLVSGFDLIPMIRGFREHENTPIIFMTSKGTVDNVTAAMALGACDFVVKPFDTAVLRAKISKQILKSMFPFEEWSDIEASMPVPAS